MGQLIKLNHEIAKKEQANLCPALTPSENAIVLASKAERIYEMEIIQTANLVTDLVSKVIIVLGQKPKDEKERELLEAEIVVDLTSEFKNMTIEEVRAAFHLGSRGKFNSPDNEVVFLSVKSIYSWLKGYRETIRKEAIGKQLRYEQDHPIMNELKEEDKLKFEVLGVRNSLLDQYKEYPNDSLAGNIYRALDKIGVIPFTTQRKKGFWKEAEEELKLKYKSAGNSINEYYGNKKLLELITSGSSEGQTEIKILAIRKALDSFLEACEEMGEDVKLMIDEKFKD